MGHENLVLALTTRHPQDQKTYNDRLDPNLFESRAVLRH